MLTPFLILMLAIGDFFLMITSSMYGISAALRLGKTGEISKTASVIYFILHFFFVADVISAILLYRSAKKERSTSSPPTSSTTRCCTPVPTWKRWGLWSPTSR